jgi:hypothetical protein
MLVCRASLYISFGFLSKGALPLGSPSRAVIDAPFPEPPFARLSKSPVHQPPPGSPTWPLWRELPVSRAFLYIPFRVPRQVVLPPCSRRRVARERNARFHCVRKCRGVRNVSAKCAAHSKPRGEKDGSKEEHRAE